MVLLEKMGKVAPLRSLLQWHVGDVILADVNLLGPIDFVVLELLEPMRQPAGHARDGEYRRKQIAWDAEALVHDPREAG